MEVGGRHYIKWASHLRLISLTFVVTLNNELEEKISEAFCIFDTHGDKYIDSRNVGNVLRFLGCAPTEKEVEDVIKATDSVDYPGEAHLVKFMEHVSKLLMDRQLFNIL